VVASWEEASWRWTSLADPELLSLTESSVTGAATTEEGLWVVLDGQLYLYDAALVPVPWAEAFTGDVVRLLGVGERLWIVTESSLYVRSEERLHEILLEGAAPQEPLAFGSEHLWVAQGSLVFALDPSTGAVVEGHDRGAEIEDLGVDKMGTVYAITEGRVHIYSEGTWVDTDVPGAREVWSVHSAVGAWVDTSGGWMHHGRDGWNHVAEIALPEQGVSLDGLGRLLYGDAEGLWRVAATRPIEIDGVASGARVEAPTPLTLVPTAPDQLVALSASLEREGEVLAIEIEEDNTLMVDPLGLVFGAWTLRITADYSDSPSGETTVPLQMAASEGASWGDHVEPIFQAHCANCHDGASQTVLTTAEDWEAGIDDILDNVISGSMPLVGEKLDDSQIGLIQAWAAGGFALE
jgi:hypothetical protein